MKKMDATLDQPFNIKVNKPWGYEIIFTPPDLPYTGKILHIQAGKEISLQVHDQKQETQMLVSGKCLYIADDKDGVLVEIPMQPLVGYTNEISQRHRLKAITDADIYEVSTPEIGITTRLEDDYHRPDETVLMRQQERKKT